MAKRRLTHRERHVRGVRKAPAVPAMVNAKAPLGGLLAVQTVSAEESEVANDVGAKLAAAPLGRPKA